MKTTKLFLAFCLAVLFAHTTLAQAPTSCSVAATLSYPLNQTVTSYTNTHYWFTVTVDSGSYRIQVASASLDHKIDSAAVYSGSSCGSLTYLGKDTIGDTSYLFIDLHDTVTTTYYIRLHNNSSVGTTFSVTTTSFVYIVGDMGFCPGQTIYLSALIYNHSGTPTYTWTPSGIHGSSIGITPSTTTTYTLTYHDANGTLTQTVSVFPLPASACKACELVSNGALESYQYRHDNVENVLLPYTSCPGYGPDGPMSDPKNWKAPTCGSPDYFNGDFPVYSPFYPNTTTYIGSVWVPHNNFTGTGSTYANSGRGYAGFFTHGPSPYYNYREYITEPLKCALVSGQLYNVSFYTSFSYYGIPSNNIGAYLSSSPVVSSTTVNLGYTPQVNAAAPINNPGSWTQVTGTMTGGGEQYITLGNFYDDAHTQFIGDLYNNPSYYFVDDISVTPATPSITVSSCVSGSLTLTAYGAASAYTTWFDGTTHYTGNPLIIASPASATTFTCYVNLNSGCGVCPTLTTVATVQPQSTCSATTNFSTPSTNGILSSSPAYAGSNVTINSGISYTINCTDLRMAAGTSITVKSGATLVIEGSWIHACNQCSNTSMWQGIIVNNGGTIITTTVTTGLLKSYNIIEDAAQAVYMSSGSTAPSYTILHTMFNNNTQNIYIDANTADLSANQIYDCVFTCRTLGTHSVLSTDYLLVTLPDIKAATPLHPSTANPTDFTIAGSARTTHGIYINSVNMAYPVHVGANAGTYGSNLFDNLDYGIYDVASSLTAINNVFQNLTGNSSSSTPFGAGIFYNGATSCSNPMYTGPCAFDATLIVGNSGTGITAGETNYFTNCLIGVAAGKARHVFINNNIFNNETTATTFNTSGSHVTGQYGVFNNKFAFTGGATAVAEQLIFANNNCQNFATGHYLDFGTLTNTVSANAILISTNTITAAGSANQYCNYGLYTQQSGTSGAAAGMLITGYEITANSITNANLYGIYATAVNNSSATSGFLDIQTNTELSVKYNPAATSPSAKVAAVSVNGSYYSRVSDNGNIRCTNYTGTQIPYAQYHEGIYVTQSPHSSINCNTITNIAENLVFEGTNPTGAYGNSLQQNYLDYSQNGLVLRNSGVIGDQGSSSYPHDNQWTSHVSWQTLADNSDPGSSSPTSKLYTRAATCSGTTYQPCTNLLVGSGHAYSTTLGTLVTASGSSTLSCTADGGHGGGSGRLAAPGHREATSEDSLYYRDMQAALNANSTPYPVYDYETRWALQHYVSSFAPYLTPAAGYEHALILARADASLAAADYGNAANLTNSFSASHIIESNWQSVNNVLVKLPNDSLSGSDISSLQNVAVQCPLSGGAIVWKARALLNSYYGTITEYPDACPANTGERIQQATGISHINAIQNNVNIYPNPNNGSFTINYTGIAKQVSIEIYNIMGQQVISQTYTNVTVIPVNGLNEGVYFVKVSADNTLLKTSKIVVTK